MMKTALFLNGIFETVLSEILKAQVKSTEKEYYLQPHSSQTIKMLQRINPNSEFPINLYISVSKSINLVSYTAQITRWEDKTSISETRIKELNEFIKRYQPKEEEIYLTVNEKMCKNLITIRNLHKLNEPISVTLLTKSSDNEFVKARSQPGGWIEITQPETWLTADKTYSSCNPPEN